MKLINSPIYSSLKAYLEDADTNKNTIFIFVPFIQTSIIRDLLENIHSQIIIVTTWRPLDLISGSSELSLYPLCKDRNIALYINNKLHLKVYSKGLDDLILATANISAHGLGLIPNYSYESAVLVDQVSNEDRLFFEKILLESTHVNEEIHEILVKWLELHRQPKLPTETFDTIVGNIRNNDFLISALPMTKDIVTLERTYLQINNGLAVEDNEIRNCVFHDLANYNIELGLDIHEFRSKLTESFFQHPFIQKIDEFISPEAYFGRIKVWIQSNCKDVPVPSRRELTANVQVLLKWFEELGGGKYSVDVPGYHSQRIRRTV